MESLSLECFGEALRNNDIECPPALVVLIGCKLSKALDVLQAPSPQPTCVHGKLDPTNVFLLANGEVTLGEPPARRGFLASKRTGELRYQAPERLLKHAVDHRLDVYSLGLTLWELASGQRVFALADEPTLRQAIVAGDLPQLQKLRPKLPAGVVHVIEQAISPDPAKRQQSAAQLYRELAEHNEHYTQQQLAGMVEYACELNGAATSKAASAPPVQNAARRKPSARRRVWLAAAGAALCAAASGVYLLHAPPASAVAVAAPAVVVQASEGVPEATVQHAFTLLNTGQAAKAAEILAPIVREHPQRTDVRYALAQAYSELGRTEDAIHQAETALVNRESDPEMWLMLAQAANALGKADFAKHAAERAARLRR